MTDIHYFSAALGLYCQAPFLWTLVSRKQDSKLAACISSAMATGMVLILVAQSTTHEQRMALFPFIAITLPFNLRHVITMFRKKPHVVD